MKKRILLFAFIAAVSGMIYAYQSGAAANGGIDGTKASGGSGGCGGSGCHNASTTNATKVELDSAGVSVTSYRPGMTYRIKLSGSNGSTSSLTKFGFQIAAVTETSAGTSNAVDAGTWGTAPTNTHITTPASSGLPETIVEQRRALSANSGGGANGSTYIVSILWTAPAAGTGSVKIFGVLNELSSQSNSKYQVASSITVTEADTTTVTGVQYISNDAQVSIYPNPGNGKLQLNIGQDVTGAEVKIFDYNGNVVYDGKLESTSNVLSFEGAAGIYLVSINKDSQMITRKIVKY